MSVAFVIMAGTIGAAVKTEWLKSKQLNIDEETKKKIMEEGIYHITTKENAEDIVKNGYMRPSVGITNNHFAKSRYGDGFANLVYMFAGKPTKERFRENISHINSKDGTIYAVKHTPDKYELDNYTQRLEDGAITYEGRLDIANSNPQVIRLKFEKGQFIEIPLDEKVDMNIAKKISESRIATKIKGLIAGTKELARNMRFIDTTKKLREFRRQRKIENKYLYQFNTEKQSKTIKVIKGDKSYTFITTGTKKQDGKFLTGFRMTQDNGDFEKNIFLDAMDITSISEEHLQGFLSAYMNETSERSEYIGKPIVKDGEVFQELDDGFSHHFYNKQLVAMRNDQSYNEYLESLNNRKRKQLTGMSEDYFKSNANRRKSALEYIKNIMNRNKQVENSRESYVGEMDGR